MQRFKRRPQDVRPTAAPGMKVTESLRNPRFLQLCRLLSVGIAVVVVIVYGAPRLYAASGDLALHYDLAEYIAKTGRWPEAGKALISGMDSYPPLAHFLAAFIGKAFNSPLLGLNVVSVLCVFGCFLLLVEAISVGSGAASALALTLAAGAVLFARTQHAVIGFEVFSNFFYAQLVGECAFLVFAYWLCLSLLDWKRRLAIAAALTFVASSLYAISAVQIALAYICLEGLRSSRQIIQERRVQASWLWPAAWGVLILPPLVALNPYFRSMVGVAGNNGGLELFFFENLVPELALLLLGVSIWLGVAAPETTRWRRGTVFIAVAGAATASSALLQVLADAALHVGSHYAVKKYGFGVITLSAFSLGALAATLVEGRRERQAWPVMALVAPPVLAAVAALCLPVWGPVSLHSFVKYERTVKAVLADRRLPLDIVGRTTSRDHDFPWFMNHAAGFVDLGMAPQMTFDIATHSDWDFTDRDLAGYVFFADHKHSVPEDCVLAHTGARDVVLIAVPCYRHALQFIKPGTVLDMATLETLPTIFASGWSGKEAAGVWSDGKTAAVTVRLDPIPNPVILTFDTMAFIPHDGYVQHIWIDVQGRRVGAWTFEAGNAEGLHIVSVPAALVRNGAVTLDFSFPDATSPADQKLSGDVRHLALFVRSIAFGNPTNVAEHGASSSRQRARRSP